MDENNHFGYSIPYVSLLLPFQNPTTLHSLSDKAFSRFRNPTTILLVGF
jgi:hypothetical protein